MLLVSLDQRRRSTCSQACLGKGDSLLAAKPHLAMSPASLGIPSWAIAMKKALGGDANTARWLYGKAEPKSFAPPQIPFPGARDRQHLTS